MRTLRTFVVLVALAGVVAWGNPAGAQNAGSPEALRAANELFALMSKDMLRRMVDAMTAQAWPTIEQALRAKRPDVDAATVTELKAEFERIETEYMASVLSDGPEIYARHFTAEELREILAFYHTPTGVKTLRILPDLMSEMMTRLMPRLEEVMKQTGEAFTKVLRQRGFPI